MSSFRVQVCLMVSIVVALAGCGPQGAAPDAAPVSNIPSSAAGVFAIASSFEVQVPPAAAPVIAALTAATDGPDDPSRYLVDRMIATLPDGPVKTLAIQAAPFIAAYLNQRIVEIAPRFVAGIGAIGDGLSRMAGHVGTIETLQIDDGGAGIRTITGARFEIGSRPLAISFAEVGLPDISIRVRVALDAGGRLAIADHAQHLPYGALLRLGLDRAVAGSVEPTAGDLETALGLLVDCERLGGLVAERIGLGTPALYRAACRAGMTAIASEVDARIAAIDDAPLGLEVTGAAIGVDVDGDGTMDEVRAGMWSGSLSSAGWREPIGAASFAGHRAR